MSAQDDALAVTIAKFKAFCAQEGLPPNTPADLVQVVSDLAVALVAKINEGIDIGMEPHPLVKAFFEGTVKKIADETVTGFVDTLRADVAG